MKQKIYSLLLISFFFCHIQTVSASCPSDIKESAALEAALSNPVITVVSVVDVVCNGGSNGAIFTSASGGTSPYYYLWSQGATTSNITILTAGTYTVTVTDAASATATASATITQPTAITATATQVSPIACNGGSTGVSVSATGGTSPYNGTGTFTKAAGNYSFVVTDNNGCTAIAVFTNTQPTALTASSTVIAPIACNGGTANVTISASGGNSPYSGTGSFAISAGTTYWTVTDSYACTATVTVTITQPCPLATNISIPAIACYGGFTNICPNITCGTFGYSYTWNNGSTSSCLNNIMAGFYTVTVTDGNSCTLATSITVTQPSPLSVNVKVVNATCGACNDGSVTLTVTGGTPPYSYSWSSGCTSICPALTNVSPGTYGVCITDVNACTACDSVILGVGTCSAAFTLTPDTLIAHHYFAVNNAMGVVPISYLWSWGDGTTDTAAYPNHTYASAGIYNICLTITDAAACTNSYCYSSYLQRTDMSMISVTVVHSLITGVGNGNNFYQDIKLFPNPANSLVTVSYSLSNASDVKIEIYNSIGQEVEELAKGSQSAGKDEVVFDSQQLPSGIYFVKVIVDGNATVLKMAKM